MVSILSHKLCVAVLIAAFALPLAFVVWRAIAGTGSWWRKILRGLGHLVVILLAQALLITGVFLYINREYGFSRHGLTCWERSNQRLRPMI